MAKIRPVELAIGAGLVLLFTQKAAFSNPLDAIRAAVQTTAENAANATAAALNSAAIMANPNPYGGSPVIPLSDAGKPYYPFLTGPVVGGGDLWNFGTPTVAYGNWPTETVVSP